MFKFEIKEDKIVINLLFLRLKMSLNIRKLIFKNLKFLLLLLDFVLPKNPKKVVALLYPKQENKVDTFLDWIKKNHSDYECVRITENKDEVSSDNKTYLFYTWKAYWEMYRAKYVVVASTRFTDYINPKRHTCLNLWHGMPIKTLGLTDGLQKGIDKIYQSMGEHYNTFVTSDLFKHIMTSCFRARYSKVHVTGLPVTDYIMNSEKNERLEIFFSIDKYKKVVLFLPTFKTKALNHKNQIDKEYENIFYMDDYQNDEFVSFLEKNEILFIMKPHPLDEKLYIDNSATLPNSENFRIVYDSDFKENQFGLYELLKYADLMISDFSSVTLDYLISDRPVIYLDNLTDEYSVNRGMILQDNYEIFMPGHKVKTYKELEEKIGLGLFNDDTEELREKTMPLIHKYRDDKASERIFELMLKG